ncbi:chemotaxis protein CheX [Clostridium sp. DJ247]|uniref:chemotaxis protein CheX n=1 Tax=Clostridium sp. DJ247 TaxID=2726188 RepID=UPI001623FD04|nr:chemotaxis protein CheX [Clostridium sp. DJ247]MBC2580614.1 chemotaxis protein CheX [Clostridium sp. DJ247]
MNEEYVRHADPFIKASQEILLQVANEETEIGEIFLRDSSFNGDNVIIVIGLVGDLHGQVIFSLSQDLACSIASKMMCGMPVTTLDEISKSAVGELANMISGTAAMIFSSNQIKLDITPPTVMVGNSIEISTTKSKSVSVSLKMKNGHSFNINVSVS